MENSVWVSFFLLIKGVVTKKYLHLKIEILFVCTLLDSIKDELKTIFKSAIVAIKEYFGFVRNTKTLIGEFLILKIFMDFEQMEAS